MLTIENFGGLKGVLFSWERSGWRFADSFEDKGRGWCMESHYTISFNKGPYGGAIVISREESKDRGYYKVRICYENYPNVVYEGILSIGDIKDRNRFFEWAIGIFETERKKKSV